MKQGEKEALVKYRITRAKETLDEVDVQIQNGYLANATNRLYYACFYGVTALLAHYDINSKTHSGTRQMFGLHFIKPGIISEKAGDFYKNIFDMRQTGDYEDFFVFEKDTVVSYIQPARDLIEEIEQILLKP